MRSQYKAFDNAIRNYDRVASLPRPSPFALGGTVVFPPGGRERLAPLREQLLANDANPELVANLFDVIETADDVAITRLRPYELAEAWGADRRDVLELCLWAVRVGLLEFRWEVLCPLCRGPQISASTLSNISPHIHCDACNVDDTANFDRSIEVTFRPNPSIRKIDLGDFCVGSPQLTPHIVVQQLMPAGDARTLKVPLETGRYRFRALQVPGNQLLKVSEEGTPNQDLHASINGWPEGEFEINSNPELNLRNDTDQELLMILERTAWSDKSATAAEVTALQLFRDLFASEALRPGEQISVGSVTILFTDLRESTRLYREVGDAVAFGRVMNHFDSLREAIAAEQGALVKTIGDSVMAVFTQPVNAIRAILRAQHELMYPLDGMLPLYLKAGIHFGPCIAVTLNDRLDYFGTTVNIAARLEGLSVMGGIVISEAVRNDPEVRAYLENIRAMASIEEFEGKLKGFDDQSFALHHISLVSKL
jgi:class 3 adenylate cyclase